MKLYLLDIDGTLTNSHGAGRQALTEAIRELTGKSVELSIDDVAGRTDLYIIRRLAEKHFEEDEFPDESKLLQEYVSRLANLIDEPEFLPGALEIIEHIRSQGGVLGLLTGNMSEAAEIKLGREIFGRFSIRATGDYGESREELIQYAIQAFEKEFGRSPAKIIVVGDTPYDIDCARSVEAFAVAVATGPYGRLELSSADVVLNNLNDFFRLATL